MQYTDSNTQSAEFLRLAVPFLAKHKLAANPVAYTVAYEYFARSNSELVAAIDSRLDQDPELTDEFIDSLFHKHILDSKERNLRRMHEEIKGVINNLFNTTSVADEEASRFTEALTRYGEELKDSTEAGETAGIIKGLLADTLSMQSVTSNMQNQLEERQKEINLLRDQLAQVREESQTDPLTGLKNRKGFDKAIAEVLSSEEVSMDSRCILMLDIDHFKRVNDTYGHLIGDKVIQFVAATLKKQVKGKDTVARFGGEEFIVLLPETPLPGAVSVAENIRTAIEKTRIKRMDTGEPIGQVTISIGVARFQPNESVEELLERADTALYQSKQNGRNQVTVDESGVVALNSMKA